MNKMMELINKIPVVILAGGTGIYLDDSGHRIAKGEAIINDKPLIYWIVNNYIKHGFSHFIISGGYRLDQLQDALLKSFNQSDHNTNDNKFSLTDHFGRRISFLFINSGLNSQTAERIDRVKLHLNNDDFAVSYSDSFADIDLTEVYKTFKEHNKLAVLVAVKYQPRFRMLGIRSGDSLVRGFSDNVFMPGHLINGGYYFFKKQVFDSIKNWKTLETTVLEKLVEMKELDSYIYDGEFRSLDSERDILQISNLVSNHQSKGK